MPLKLSYREQLTRIGIAPTASVSYRSFYSKPRSLRQAMLSMNAPTSQDWSQASDIFRDDSWTDEVQGVCWDGAHWIFSANANQTKPGHHDKAIYIFKGGHSLGDDKWISMIKYKDVPHPVSGTENDDHWGQVCYHKGLVYVSHFWSGGPKEGVANVVVFRDHGGFLEFNRWIELDRPKSPTDGRQDKAEFQTINPWDEMLYSCFGSGTIYEFFKHDLDTGKFTGQTLRFNEPVTQVQGACFSANGHLYVASNATLPGDAKYQTIWYYSALNGHRLGVVPVLAEEGMPDQELEGICFAGVSFGDGNTAQIHAVLLENRLPALDNIFLKSFSSAKPEIV